MITSLVKFFVQKNAATMVSMVLLVVLPLLGSSSATYLLYRNQTLLAELGLGAALGYFGLTALTMAFALTPTTFVALVTGFYFGWAGLPGMVAAYALAAFLGYQVASALDHGKMTSFLSYFPKADAVMKELQHESWQLIVLTRISPVLPFALMTFVLAVLRVERRRFLLASVLGMLPRSLFFYWLGSKAQDAAALLHDSETGTAGKALLLGLVAISLYGLYYLFNRALQRALRRSTTPN